MNIRSVATGLVLAFALYTAVVHAQRTIDEKGFVTLKLGQTEALPAGGFVKHPAKEAHFDGAKDEKVILQIAGIGPSDTIFFKPELGRTGKSQ